MAGIGDWIPTSVARHRLGVSRQRIQQLCESGKLNVRKLGGILLIEASSVERRRNAMRVLKGG